MKTKKILLLMGHPNAESYCAQLLDAYMEGAKAAGAEVRMCKLSEMEFDANLKMGYKEIQALEPDLRKFQADILWADHFVLAFPMWWGGMPAMLQGLFDRSFLPGFAFKFKEGSPFQAKLLSGRTARALITMDSPSWWYRLILGRPLTLRLKRQILKFCGFKPAKTSIFGGVGHSKPEQRAKYLAKAKTLGQKLA